MVEIISSACQIFLIDLTEGFIDHRLAISDLLKGVCRIVEEIASGEIHLLSPFVAVIKTQSIGIGDSSRITHEEIITTATAKLVASATGTSSTSGSSGTCNGANTCQILT